MSERISYADEDGKLGAMHVPVMDRALGATLAFFGVLITLALAPIILLASIPRLAAFQHPFFVSKLWGFFFVGALWIIPAAIAGWVVGFPKVLSVFSHIWFTADPPNGQLSLRLWCGIIFICALTSFAIFPL